MVTMQVYVQYPDKLRVELKNPTGDIVTSVFDGKKGWVIKGTAFRPFPEGYYDALRAQIDGQIGFFYKNLTNIKKRKIKAEYSGEGENRNMQVAKLTVTEANGAQWLVYFEKSRYFDIRYDFLKDIKGNKQNSTFHIRNFIPVGGYYFASAADVYTNNTESGSIVFSDIVVNPKLNKSLFLIPKK
jgi:outer membrane lipoprotein-sorting protein